MILPLILLINLHPSELTSPAVTSSAMTTLLTIASSQWSNSSTYTSTFIPDQRQTINIDYFVTGSINISVSNILAIITHLVPLHCPTIVCCSDIPIAYLSIIAGNLKVIMLNFR